MNNDELKKKIVKTLQNTVFESEFGSKNKAKDFFFEIVFERFADNLISAGIGDLSELKKHRILVKPVSIPNDENFYIVPQTEIDIKQLYNGEEVEQIVKERDKYKHRAEVAERALYIATSQLQCRVCRVDECGHYNRDYDGGCMKAHLKQAEKELEEEGI